MIDIRELDRRKRQDVEDLDNEIAGRDVGRRARFLGGKTRSDEIEQKRREERAFQNRLLELLNDPIYRAKYLQVMHTLTDAERATEAALANIDKNIARLLGEISAMEDRAARLPDGSLVFRDANGIVRRANGIVVEDDLAATILWRGNEPSYEGYRKRQNDLAAYLEQRSEVEDYLNNVLGPARDHLTDPDDPPSLRDLDDIEDSILQTMPSAVSSHMPGPVDQTVEVERSATVVLPKLGS